MTFNQFYKSVKKKFNEHEEIVLDCDKIAIQISDINNKSFYILWENGKISVEPYTYNDFDVCITSSQDHLELLFTERQYIFSGQNALNIAGSFTDVMMFQRLLSFITKDNTLVIQEEIIANMLFKEDMISRDLGVIMETLHLLLVNNVIDLPEKENKSGSTTSKRTAKKTANNSNTKKETASKTKNSNRNNNSVTKRKTNSKKTNA